MFSWFNKKNNLKHYGEFWGDPQLQSFADLLPYSVFNQENMLFELPDGDHATAIGFLLECLPQIGISEQIESTMQDLSSLLPEGATCQIAMYADPNVNKQLIKYCRNRNNSSITRGQDIHQRIARMRYSFLNSLGDELRPFNYRLFISVTVRGSIHSAEDEQKINRIRQSIETTFAGCAIPSTRLGPSDLINIVAGIINPQHISRREFFYSPNETIAHQCLLRDTEINVNSNLINVSGNGKSHDLMSLMVSRYPNSMRLGGMLGLLGDPVRANLRYLGPFLITLCLQVIDQEKARTLISIKQARARTNLNSPMAKIMPGYYQRQFNDWQICSEAIDKGGGMILLSHQILIQANVEQMAVAEEKARSVWRSRGFTLANNEYLQMQGLMAALPLSLTPNFAQDLKSLGMLSMKTTFNAAHGMPVISEWKGTNQAAMLLLGRRGQLMNLDIFDSNGNHNLVVAGASGSGKSVLLNEIAASSLGLGAKVWIFDIGRSYLHASRIFGGQEIHFDAKTNVCLNPFSVIVDINEDMRLLKPVFAQMIAPKGGLSDFQRAQLELAIKQTWSEKKHLASPVDLYHNLLKVANNDSRIVDMAAMLVPFTTGAYARWFNGPATINLQAEMIVFELEELNKDPDLQAVIMLQLLYFVAQEMYASRDRRKLVLIDEAYELMRGENVSEFIEQGYRRARKYNGAFLSATQSIGDFYANPAGRSAIANSDWMMLLSQKDEEVRQLIDQGKLALTPSEFELVRSLNTKPGQYSEVFIRCEGTASGVGRLAIDKYSELLYSSNAKDQQAIYKYKKQGLSIEESILAVIKERGHG